MDQFPFILSPIDLGGLKGLTGKKNLGSILISSVAVKLRVMLSLAVASLLGFLSVFELLVARVTLLISGLLVSIRTNLDALSVVASGKATSALPYESSGSGDLERRLIDIDSINNIIFEFPLFA